MIMFIKEIIIKGVVEEIDIKNRTYYFYNDMINIKKLDSNFVKNL